MEKSGPAEKSSKSSQITLWRKASTGAAEEWDHWYLLKRQMAACGERRGREKTHLLDHTMQVRTLSEKNVGRVRALSQLFPHLPSPPSSWTSLPDPHLGLILVTLRVTLLTLHFLQPPSDVWNIIPTQPRLLSMKTMALHAASWAPSAFKMPLLVRPNPTTRTPQSTREQGADARGGLPDFSTGHFTPSLYHQQWSFAVLIEMQIQIIKSTFKNRMSLPVEESIACTHTEGSWNACLQNKAASSRLWIIPSPESDAIFCDGVTGSLNQAATSLLRECSLAGWIKWSFPPVTNFPCWVSNSSINRERPWLVSVFSLRCAQRGLWSAARALGPASLQAAAGVGQWIWLHCCSVRSV